MITPAPEVTFKSVVPISVSHSCNEPYVGCLAASVVYDDDQMIIKQFQFNGHMAMVDKHHVYDIFGRKVEFDKDILEVISVESPNTKSDWIFVRLIDGQVSSAEVQYRGLPGWRGKVQTGGFIPSQDSQLSPSLIRMGESFDDITRLSGIKLDDCVTHVGRRHLNYYLLEGDTGCIIQLPVDLSPTLSARPRGVIIKTLCSRPFVENGKLYADANIGETLYHLMIEPSCGGDWKWLSSDKNNY